MSCGHIVKYPTPIPDLGSEINCPDCNAYRIVTEVPDYWEARCTYRRGCRHGVGKTEDMAMRFAGTHIRQYQHPMEIRHKGLVVRTWEPIEEWTERERLIDPGAHA